MWRQLSAGVGATCLAVSVWVGISPFAPEPIVFPANDAPVQVSQSAAGVMTRLGDSVLVEPILFAPLGDGPPLSREASFAVSAAGLVAGSDLEDDRWQIDLVGSPVMADRVAIGLIQRGVSFERSIEVDVHGDVGSVLSGPGSIADVVDGLPSSSTVGAATQLSTIVELTGAPDGTLGPAQYTSVIDELASIVGLDPISVDGAPTIWALDDFAVISSLPVTDPQRVPGLAGQEQPVAVAEEIELTASSWTPATTGPLAPGATHPLSPEEGGIGWTNREAQIYDPTRVLFDGRQIELLTERSGPPSIDALPFRSGMVIADRTIEWGTLDVDITLPSGDGLWPAVWLLDAEACDAPGRCPNYATTAYHEIDLIETRGDRPAEAATSLHWFEERLRSTSGLSAIEPGQRLRITVERRPGIIVWRIDGEVVYVVGGPVVGGPVVGGPEVSAGPHRSGPMHLIINTAVGGNYAGGQLIGRNGEWWGDAQVPDSFPNLGWDSASLTVHGVRYTPVG